MIQAEGLTKFYGSVPAIQNVTFEVEKGEIVGFLGPNGAGKTTTIRILTCYMPPTVGTARVGGRDCFQDSLEVRRMIGYLPENVPLYGEMTVRGFLAFAARARGVEARQRSAEVKRVMGICGLENVERRIIAHLSKGYRQRVGLAQALLNNPPVLILDEPTIGLDPAQIVDIRRLISDLRDDHTILLSSHILPEVAQICRRVMIINRGQIVATDTPANLTAQLQKSAQVFLRVARDGASMVEVLSRLPGVQQVTLQPGNDGALMIETDRTQDMRGVIARTVVEHGVDLLELRSVDLSLEDIFMQLVTEETAEAEQEAVS